MGGIDKNQALGFVLLSTLLLIYMVFFMPDPPQTPQQPTTLQTDSLKNTQMQRASLADSTLQKRYGVFSACFEGKESEEVLENDDIHLTFSTKGAKIKRVLLKKFVTYEKQPLVLIDEKSSKFSEVISTSFGLIDLNELFYGVTIKENQLIFTLVGNDGSELLTRTYTLSEKGFVVNYVLENKAGSAFLRHENLSFYWQDYVRQQEKDLSMSRSNTTVNYYTIDESFDYLSASSNELETAVLSQPARFISFKQKFFNTSIITDATFHNVSVTADVVNSDKIVKRLEMKLEIPLSSLSGKGNVRYYLGPNDYDICKTVAPEFERNVDLGWRLFAAINKYTIVPLFQLLEKVTSNYGLIIIILVFIIRAAMFPLSYKSYVSMAKMKVLKPEIDALREKYGEDMTKLQQETMKLYSQVGANPLSGCLPMLAQIPVFLALFNFFPNAIQLRQQSFLWADDLSSYDSILDLPFHIPMYGNHVSLFTLIMTVTQLILTYQNNKYTPATTPQAEQMKIMGYIMPVMFLFFLNSFSSGLTLYYCVSNLISIAQMSIIRKFVDDEKIKKILEENRKKNLASGKRSFIERLEEVRKQQEELKQQRQQKQLEKKKQK